MFFFSSRRRHTRYIGDWRSDVCFFFQAEDGIRDTSVNGVQTCALPIFFVILVPLAAFLGYLLADPDFGSFILIGGFVCLLLSPIFLRWHHLILVASWNLWVVIFFLPGGTALDADGADQPGNNPAA